MTTDSTRRDCPALTLCALLRADIALERARRMIAQARAFAVNTTR